MSLIDASARGDVTAVKKLLAEDGADVNQASKIGWTPLYSASYDGHTKYSTPLNVASQNGHTEVVRLLLHAGADVNQATKNGNTPLNVASYNGHPEYKDGWTFPSSRLRLRLPCFPIAF